MSERFICLSCRITFDYAPRYAGESPYCPRCALHSPREVDVVAGLDAIARQLNEMLMETRRELQQAKNGTAP